MRLGKVLKASFLIMPFIFCIVLVYTKSTDLEQDLGRHLTLGKIIWETRTVPRVNMFSFTNPLFPFINHHWLSEVVFYVLVSRFGLFSLYILRVVLVVGAFFLTLYASVKVTSFRIAGLISLLFLPLLFERLYIRPELFGFFLFSLEFYVLFITKQRTLSYFIPFILLLWVNLHISFVFGLFLLIVYGMSEMKRARKKTIFLFIFSVCALICNPNGLAGAFYPFTMFGNYGYNIVENQNIFFLNSVMLNPLIRYFFVLLPLIIGSAVLLLFHKKYQIVFLFLTFFLASIWQIRHTPFFVFIAIPATSIAAQEVIRYIFSINVPYKHTFIRILPLIYVGLVGVGIFFFISGTYNNVFDIKSRFGVGFFEEEKQATDFIKQYELPSQIFNNFDVGGYLIYRLYPRYSVFVDNRPEAYPADFFSNSYIPLQEHINVRDRLFKQYNIHTVVFSHQDGTPWADMFIRDILIDSDWRVVFVNSKIIVLTDDASFKDIRSDPGQLTSLVDKENDYLSLLHLSVILEKMNFHNISSKAFIKAYQINPSSCAVKTFMYQIEKNTPDYFIHQDEKKIPWWCLSL